MSDKSSDEHWYRAAMRERENRDRAEPDFDALAQGLQLAMSADAKPAQLERLTRALRDAWRAGLERGRGMPLSEQLADNAATFDHLKEIRALYKAADVSAPTWQKFADHVAAIDAAYLEGNVLVTPLSLIVRDVCAWIASEGKRREERAQAWRSGEAPAL